VVPTARIDWLRAGRCDRTTGAGVSGRAGTANLQGGSQICNRGRWCGVRWHKKSSLVSSVMCIIEMPPNAIQARTKSRRPVRSNFKV
jgi:hypothetical protein